MSVILVKILLWVDWKVEKWGFKYHFSDDFDEHEIVL